MRCDRQVTTERCCADGWGLPDPSVLPTIMQGRSCRLDLQRPLIMGILNVTPDSFFSGSRAASVEDAVTRALRMQADGADLIDVGGESTRPGAALLSEQEEIDRVVPVLEALADRLSCPLSIDTNKSAVARAAVAVGAEFVNDISGFAFDADMARTVADCGAGAFLMHTRGRPEDMQADTVYEDLFAEVVDYLQRAVVLAEETGIPRAKLAVDPGIGFGKDLAGNLEILSRLRELHALGLPVLLGTSRKSFIGRVIGQPDPAERLSGTLSTIALGVACGVQIFRVHDVRAAREAALMAWSVVHRQLP
ncbi:dihydropteroate synthase [Syntrophotalea carbinolica DSM 2380]|uniref:Dihydropteroate synthase n=1 Tax=Syntrophotalea carbinolica (strain DSM 2380 / NBRC 103641 / GraBd1) TaxID=338963 RepID=Q3A5V8_SYNC1|nr:dihydropteroate synthase [Syntrophotalea carbinolica]ABA88249.1 dihydropteroate synthase [Syntrophotalea carbinolica DSM 2380]